MAIIDMPTKNLCFTVSGYASKLFDTPPRGGFKYCITLFDENDNRYRLYSYTKHPTIRHGGHVVSLNRGDVVRCVGTVGITDQGQLISLVYSTMELLD